MSEMQIDSIHTLSLNSIHDSKITNINLYTNRAEVTRSYRIAVAAGQTKLTLSCLPNVIDYKSIRVEGRGAAIIQGVTAFKADLESPDETSPLLEELNDKKAKARKAQQRYQKTIDTIDNFVGNISIEHMDISKLSEAMDIYDTTEEKWADKLIQAKKEVESIKEQIDEEHRRLQEMVVGNKKLRTNVVIGLYAPEVAELEIVLIYAVSHASWKAGYDIRVIMQTPDAPIKVVYKAAINQRTGEAWENVPVTLETARPTFGMELPSLRPWNITHQKPSRRGSTRFLDLEAEVEEDEEDDAGSLSESLQTMDAGDEYQLEAEVTDVTSKGNVNATFRVPGLSTIPSDEEEHFLTIADLELEAKVSWACIPKCDTKVYLEAKITNSSEYTFLPGLGHIYVDQSFISCSEIPGVSPLEVFKCPLGVDPSILAESGFYNKSLIYKFTQRISIHNTKSILIDGLRITDNIPVSQDANLTVTLTSPALPLPPPEVAAVVTGVASDKALPPPLGVKVSDGVNVMWKGMDELGIGKDVSGLGKDGKIDWLCAIPALGRVNIVLQWEVVTPLLKTEIFGL